MTKRHRAREVALQMLFQSDLNPDVSEEAIREQIKESLREQGLSAFAWSLYAGVYAHRQELDRLISECASNWALHRMAVSDRNALRLGAFELIHTDAPARVVLDEVIELAKTFGSEQSPAFVNGILDRLIPAAKRQPKINPTPPETDTVVE